MKREKTETVERPKSKRQKIEEPFYQTTVLPIIETQKSPFQSKFHNSKFYLRDEIHDDIINILVYEIDHGIKTLTDIKFTLPLSIEHYALHPDGTKLAYFSEDGRLKCIDASNHYKTFTISTKKFEADTFLSFHWSVNGKYFWVTRGANLVIFDVQNNLCLAEYTYTNFVSLLSYITHVHPKKENVALVSFGSTHVVFEYNPDTNEIIRVPNSILETSLFMSLDPFCENWTNLCDFTDADKIVIWKDNESLIVDENYVKCSSFKVPKYGKLLNIDNMEYLDSNRVFFVIDEMTDIMTDEESFFYCCIIDISEGLKSPKIKSWRISEDQYINSNISWSSLLFRERPIVKYKNENEEVLNSPIGEIITDVWTHIFTFFDEFDLMNASLVCKEWKSFADPMWKSICLHKWKLHPKNVENWKKYCLLRMKVESFSTIVEVSDEINAIAFHPTKYKKIIDEYIKILLK